MKPMTDKQLEQLWLISDRIHGATNELRKLYMLLAETPDDRFAQNPCTNSLHRMLADLQDLRLLLYSEDLAQTTPVAIDELTTQEDNFGPYYAVNQRKP